MDEKLLLSLKGDTVIIDTGSPLIYIGILSGADEDTITLANVDVHDINDTQTTKELYILETRKYGVKQNRRETSVMRSAIVSISRLSDVIEY